MVTLRPHQNRAIKAMHENTKGQVIVPTGGGKTMIMIHHALQKFAKNETEVVAEVVEENVTEAVEESKEEISNDQWYQSTLFESLKRKWTK